MRVADGFRQLGRMLLVIVLAGLLGATMVRLAPGYGVDERDLGVHQSAEARAAREAKLSAEGNAFQFYVAWMQRLMHGDLGVSRSLERPVATLLRERISVTLRYAAVGLVAAWVTAFVLALASLSPRMQGVDWIASTANGLLLCLPTALVALLLFLISGPPAIAIALVLLPQFYFFLRAELRQAAQAPHLLLARAKGLSSWRVLVWHLLPAAVPSVTALAGLSIALAFGAAVPIESFGDVPGIGQLTWQAALSRDLPLLTSLLLVLTAATLTANGIAEGVVRWWTGSAQ